MIHHELDATHGWMNAHVLDATIHWMLGPLHERSHWTQHMELFIPL